MGGQFFSVSRAGAQFVVTAADAEPGYRRFYARTLLPDEGFFQTLVMNSPMAGTVVNNDLRCEDWSGRADGDVAGLRAQCSAAFVRDRRAGSPRICGKRLRYQR
jgi:hypothetical protein